MPVPDKATASVASRCILNSRRLMAWRGIVTQTLEHGSLPEGDLQHPGPMALVCAVRWPPAPSSRLSRAWSPSSFLSRMRRRSQSERERDERHEQLSRERPFGGHARRAEAGQGPGIAEPPLDGASITAGGKRLEGPPRPRRGVFCQVVLNKWDCGGNLGPRLARSLSQLHGRGYGPSPGHVVRTGRHPYGGPISGRFPWHARSIGRAPPLPSSRAPRSRRSSARGSRRLPRPPHARATRRRRSTRATRLPPRSAPRPRPPRPRRSPRGTLSTGPRPCRRPQISPVPRRAPMTEVAPGPGVPVPPQVRVEHPRELAGRSPAPIAPAGELCLGAAEEALAPRVAGAAPLPRHRPGQAVRLADPDPPRPAMAAAPVRARGRAVALAQPLARAEQRRVCRPRVGRGRDRPARRHAVEAARDRRETGPASRGAGPGRVGHPLLVGGVGPEVVPPPLVAKQVRGRLGDPAPMGAVAPSSPRHPRDQASPPVMPWAARPPTRPPGSPPASARAAARPWP